MQNAIRVLTFLAVIILVIMCIYNNFYKNKNIEEPRAVEYSN